MKRFALILTAVLLLAAPAPGADSSGDGAYFRGREAYLAGDFPTALSRFKESGEKGHPQALYHLGMMYEKGQGVRQNYEAAVTWYEKAAERGHRPALIHLYELYAEGHGVP